MRLVHPKTVLSTEYFFRMTPADEIARIDLINETMDGLSISYHLSYFEHWVREYYEKIIWSESNLAWLNA